MLIKEVCTVTKLTKKAVEYYEEQELICPKVLENGYRDFSADDIEILKKVSILRKLGLGTDDIKIALSDENGEALQKISIEKELKLQREKEKQSLLDKLSRGKNWEEISEELKVIEQKETISEKLLYAFPGYYGRFVSLHFSRFLNETITTAEQQEDYEEIINFLDNIPALEFPNDLQEFLVENTKHISNEDICQMLERMKQSIENVEKFLSENKEFMEEYLVYKKSDEYKNSPAHKIKSLLEKFNNSSGYYHIFIPAMKRLSSSYAEYCKQMEAANEKLLAKYPEIER